MKEFVKLFQFFIYLFLLFLSNSIIYSQWNVVGQVSGFGGYYPRISVVDSNIVWVAGGAPANPSNSYIYRTINGGLNWTTIPTIGLPYYPQNLAAKDSLTAFVADGAGGFAGNAKMFKTTNAGVNWILIDSTGVGSVGYYNGIEFSKTVPNFGFAQSAPPNGPGTPLHINITTNSGVTWRRESSPAVAGYFGLINSPFVIDSLFYGSIIMLATAPQTFDSYITSNGGISWYRGFDTLPLTLIGDIVFNDNKMNGIMVAGNLLPNIELSSNGGINWYTKNIMTNISGNSEASWISGTNTVFIGAGSNTTTGNTIIRSDNGGLNWIEQSTSGTNFIREIDYKRYGNKVIAYAVNRDGIILKSRQDVVITGINIIESKIPSHFSLYQNYPNPFNPTTKIKFDVPSSVKSETPNIKLIIYDALGKEISKLVDQNLNEGSYEVEFIGTNLSSGVYFYKLTNEDYNETKKMFLTK